MSKLTDWHGCRILLLVKLRGSKVYSNVFAMCVIRLSISQVLCLSHFKFNYVAKKSGRILNLISNIAHCLVYNYNYLTVLRNKFRFSVKTILLARLIFLPPLKNFSAISASASFPGLPIFTCSYLRLGHMGCAEH